MAVMDQQLPEGAVWGYAVTDGVYSDYYVVALFASEDEAHQYAFAGGLRVERFPFFPGDRPLGLDVREPLASE